MAYIRPESVTGACSDSLRIEEGTEQRRRICYNGAVSPSTGKLGFWILLLEGV